MTPLALICTGYHRSGTSLTGKRLQRAGLSMGSQLVPAHPSNPDGHYEDGPVVAFHDAWLHRQGSDWLFHDEAALEADAKLGVDIGAYLASRDADGRDWALKDPRLTLALPAWDQALGDRGRYLLMIRHWAECAQSLFHRHSREMAHHLLRTTPGGSPHFRPWLEPNTIYRSWLAYNSRLIAFAARNPDRVAIVTARGMAELGSLAPLVQQRLGITLAQPDAEAGLRQGLLSRRVDVAALPPVPLWLERSLDAMWQELLVLSDCRAGNEDIEWSSRRLAPWVRAGIRLRVGAHFPALAPAAPRPARNLDPVPVASTLALLDLVPVAQRGNRALAAARRAFAVQQYDQAQTVLEAGIAAGGAPYPLLLLLGDIESARRRFPAAMARYREALAVRVTDQGRMKAARCMMALGEWSEALEMLTSVAADGPDAADARLLRARCVENIDGPEAAVAALMGGQTLDAAALNARAQIVLSQDSEAGMRLYRENVRTRLESRALDEWLASACVSIPAVSSWDAFVEAVYRHWCDVLGEDRVQRQLGLPAWPDDARLKACIAPPAERPDVAIGGASLPAMGAALSSLQALGWHMGEFLDASGQHLGFSEVVADPALLDADPEDAAPHAAIGRFLASVIDELHACPAPPAAWGWMHGGSHRPMAALLRAMPRLRYLHVVEPGLAAAWQPGSEDFHRWASLRAQAGRVQDQPYWRLRHRVVVHREAQALQQQYPGRVFLLDAQRIRAGDRKHRREWLAFLEVEPAPDAAWPDLRFQALVAPRHDTAEDLRALDPQDLDFMRSNKLLD